MLEEIQVQQQPGIKKEIPKQHWETNCSFRYHLGAILYEFFDKTSLIPLKVFIKNAFISTEKF